MPPRNEHNSYSYQKCLISINNYRLVYGELSKTKESLAEKNVEISQLKEEISQLKQQLQLLQHPPPHGYHPYQPPSRTSRSFELKGKE